MYGKVMLARSNSDDSHHYHSSACWWGVCSVEKESLQLATEKRCEDELNWRIIGTTWTRFTTVELLINSTVESRRRRRWTHKLPIVSPTRYQYRATDYRDTKIMSDKRKRTELDLQESPAIADKPARRESMPKIAPIRRAYNVVTDSTGLSSFV